MSFSGRPKCVVLSVLDLKEAFHPLRLSKHSKKYCGILPYFGSASYLYQRMPMGLNIPLINMAILYKSNFRLFTEQKVLLFTPSKGSHIAKLEDLLKPLLKNGLEISPKK